MNRTRIGRCVIASISILLAGCSTLLDGKYDFQAGWRRAEVIQILPVSLIERPSYYKCLRNASAEQRAAGDFAILSYRTMGKERRHAMPVPPNSVLQIGTKVYANMDACDGRIIPRHN